ncbi:hypothetical protein [Actinomadura atramentaria]|uniref:hypothetical protein n=1 Tax=Actinomadura atramentaria TaxID=1990 RepID=UPI00035C5CD4|nr:hypothetical protein [Actinomadura atramentaria]
MDGLEWWRTGDARFPVAANMDGCWVVLRLNGFPDHPLWTVFVDGAARWDADALPPEWGAPLETSATAPDPALAAQVLAPVQGFAVYGSEVGEPCDDPVCCPV